MCALLKFGKNTGCHVVVGQWSMSMRWKSKIHMSLAESFNVLVDRRANGASKGHASLRFVYMKKNVWFVAFPNISFLFFIRYFAFFYWLFVVFWYVFYAFPFFFQNFSALPIPLYFFSFKDVSDVFLYRISSEIVVSCRRDTHFQKSTRSLF